MIWILTISACLISLGLNVWLIARDGKKCAEIIKLREVVEVQASDIERICSENYDLRPKRDAHGRFTR